MRLMKHILKKKVLFYEVIVKTFWMTLVGQYISHLLFISMLLILTKTSLCIK